MMSIQGFPRNSYNLQNQLSIWTILIFLYLETGKNATNVINNERAPFASNCNIDNNGFLALLWVERPLPHNA